MRRFSPRFALLCVLSLLSACAGGDSPAGPTRLPPPPAPAPIPPGILSLTVSGLPAGTNADITVAGAAFTRAATGTVSWVDVPAGQHTVTVRAVRTADGSFAASPSTFSVMVVSGSTPATATITYAPLPTAVDLTISGVPGGVDAPVTVSVPGVGDLAAAASRVVTSPNSGRWKVAAGTLLTGGFRYAPSPAAIDTLVLHGDTARLAVRYDVSSGALAVAVTGLSAGLAGAVQVSGPEGFSRTVTATSTLTELTPGAYRLIASPVSAGGISFRPAADTVTVTVSASLVAAPATVAYAAQVGRVVVTTSGLPADAAPALTLTGNGPARALSGPATLDSLPSGSYVLSAAPLTVAGVRYRPATASQTLAVTTGTTTTADVAFTVVPTVVEVPVSGLPNGTAANLTLTSPSGDATPISATTRISPAIAGRWRLSAAGVTSSGAIYLPTPTTRDTSVTAGDTLRLPVQYSITTGSIAVALNGLPGGSAGRVTVTGPGDYSQTLTSTSTLTLLVPGSYTVTAASVTAAGTLFVPSPASRVLTVVASLVATPAPVSYAVVPTVVEVPVSGLPNGTAANITLTSPSGSASPISATTRISPAAAGRWQLTAASVTSGGANYLPTPTTRDATVAAGDTLRLPIQYAITTGSIAVVVTGLPGGSAGNVIVTGPGGYAQSVSGTTTLTLLAPGSYTVTAASVSATGTTYLPSPTSQLVSVAASLVATPATVSYALASGAVTISASGLPGGVTPTFSLTGTGAPRMANGAGTVSSLPVGSWTVTANTVVSGSTTYTPSPSSLNVSITPNGNASASFAYATNAAANYAITNVYLTQAIQRLDNSVTLVAGRDALLRVFARANAANSARPDVRVRIYDGVTLLQTATITAPEASVRTTIDEGTMASTWNVAVPGANIRPTTRVLVDLDPTLAVADADRSDNTWPTNGTPQSVSVNTVPTFNVRFVPIVVGALTGNVTTGNRASFLSSAQRMFPLNTIASDVRAPFTSSATDIQSNDGNGQWLTVLSEMNALRTTDGAPSTMHYYGVLKVSYTSGIAGYGYVPGRAAIGWDHLPSGDRVAAHEWGHNFSRNHAPCGTSGDANYPHAGGVINFWGWNSLSNTLVSPTATDVMGYCGNQWISDYNWAAVMQYRSASGSIASTNAPGEGVLVWGRVVNGVIQLEPAFRVNAPASASTTSASHRLELLDATGATLLDTPIEAQRVDHATATDERQFAVIVPWSAVLEERLASIRVRDARSPLLAVARQSARMTAPGTGGTPIAPQLQAQVDRTTTGRARVTWNSAAYPMAMVRDAETGALMGFVRRSGDAVVTGGRAVEVVYSDGVRTITAK